MTYERFDGHVGEYRFDPYHLLAYHGDWYVLGFHHARGKLATFAVSRVRDIVPTGESFAVPADFDPEEHIRRGFGIVRGERVERVRLLFSPAVSGYIRERVWHPTQHMRVRRDGSVELRLETAGWKELVRWILSWQPDVKVLSPKRLRERVREKLRQGLARG